MAIRKTTDFLVVHCSATKPTQDVGASEIRRWHLERGWSDIGYHQVIRRNGVVELGRSLTEVGAHVKGYNRVSVGVCLVGGIDVHGNPADNFTAAQYESLETTLDYWKLIYPHAVIQGHRDFPGVSKSCPCFDVKAWLG